MAAAVRSRSSLLPRASFLCGFGRNEVFSAEQAESLCAERFFCPTETD